MANLVLGYGKDVAKRATTTVLGSLKNEYVSFDFQTSGSVIDYIQLREKALGNEPEKRDIILRELTSRFLKMGSVGLIAGADASEQATAAYLAYDFILKNPDHPTAKFSQSLPGDPVIAIAEFAKNMYRQQVQVSIKTLPAFHFSTGKMFMSPCILLAQDAPILQSEIPESTFLNSFMSGWYSILRYTHKIGSHGASSEFNLVKNVASNFTKEEGTALA